MRALFVELEEKVMNRDDNAIIVSQFTSMLELVHQHLKENDVKCLVLTGSVPVKERMALVDQFNSSLKKPMVSAINFDIGNITYGAVKYMEMLAHSVTLVCPIVS
jgi:transcription termination factor 2